MTGADSWLQIHLNTTATELDPIETALLDAGALSITLREPGDEALLEPAPGATPLWSHMRVTGLFPGDADALQIQQAIRESMAPCPVPALEFEALAGRVWEREWLKDFGPMQFGRSLWICPHGQSVSADNAKILYLDPGLAFGTGTHPTTALCLEWLDMHEQQVQNADILDFGCGSGILGLSAALLGAQSVYCADIDPQALDATRANQISSGLQDCPVRAGLPDEIPAGDFNIVLANILASTLINLAANITARVRPGGLLVLSGILEDQALAVHQAYAGQFPDMQVTTCDGWSRLAGSRVEPGGIPE